MHRLYPATNFGHLGLVQKCEGVALDTIQSMESVPSPGKMRDAVRSSQRRFYRSYYMRRCVNLEGLKIQGHAYSNVRYLFTVNPQNYQLLLLFPYFSKES